MSPKPTSDTAAPGPALAHAASSEYLTRRQVAQRYPISTHTLAKLAATGKGPRFFKPTDKCLYRPADIEAWIEAAAVLPSDENTKEAGKIQRPRVHGKLTGRGRARPAPTPPKLPKNGRKSLPPSPSSWLRRTD